MLYDIVRTAYYSFHLYKFVMIVASHSEHVHCEFVTLVLTLLLENFYCDDKSSPMIAEIFQYNGVVRFFRKIDFGSMPTDHLSSHYPSFKNSFL